MRFALLLFVAALFGMMSATARAQEAEDKIGTWLIYNGTLRFSPQWSIFTEAQLRLWTVVSDPEEAFARVAGHYDFPESPAMVGLGYMINGSWTYPEGDKSRTENRIYQQFGLRQRWLRAHIDHRYRFEQRWRKRADTGTTSFSLRARYRIQVTTPLNMKEMDPGAWFLNFYDEIFVSFDNPRAFDQNRLYGAAGRQFTPTSNLQIGLLWQARASADFLRLQLFYTHNFNFHEG